MLLSLVVGPLVAVGSAAQTPALSPAEIVAAAPAKDWVAIAPEDLLVMALAPDANGQRRQVVIQVMPAPFSQGWVFNIRKLVAARWFDGVSINRVQDNYVVQWGDADGEDAHKAKPLPKGLNAVPGSAYEVAFSTHDALNITPAPIRDAYAPEVGFAGGFPVAMDSGKLWPVHCYGMVGVGRGLSPDTGTGAELYTVIGHAPRHLDRNIALVGRVIEGIEHLSVLPRGTEALGFYRTPVERTMILSMRLASELKDAPRFAFLSPASRTFAAYAEARANRRDAFFNKPAGGADICNISIPVRRMLKGE